MDITSLLIQLASGAIGGNGAGKVLPKFSLGTLGNSLVGILGGGLGGQILQLLGIDAGPQGELDLMAILGSIASGGVGGGVLMIIVGLVKSLISKK